MTQGEVPATTTAPRTGRRLGSVALIVLGYLVLLLALRFAYNAPDVVSDAEPTCNGEPLATDASCTETRREFVQRTGRISWYTEEEVTLTYDEKVAEQDEGAKEWTWLQGMAIGTAGLVVVFLGTAALLSGRTQRDAVYLGAPALLPLAAATAFVGWAETRFPPELRPGAFVWREPDGTAAAFVMAGVVVYGTWATLQGARLTPSHDVGADPGRGASFAGFQLAGRFERAVARVIDYVILYLFLMVVSIVVAIITFAVVRPLLGEDTGITAMVLGIPTAAFVVAVAYDARIATPKPGSKAKGNTIGKRTIGLRVIPRDIESPGSRGITAGAAWLRGFLWWAPVYVASFAATGFGVIDPIPYGFLLVVLPLLNLTAVLVDRRRRQSFADRFANTVVVRAKAPPSPPSPPGFRESSEARFTGSQGSPGSVLRGWDRASGS